jgi:DNA polymerase delta subunit 2
MPESLTLERSAPSYHSLSTFVLPQASKRRYGQYADLYFARLVLLKEQVERVGQTAWRDFEIAGSPANRVERVLDVRQGEVCWVVGTVFMDMPLKPSIMDDLAMENWIIAPPTRDKYFPDNNGQWCMLEDESGRLNLTGGMLENFDLCTGCIVAVLGTENEDGAFDVIDVKLADLPIQPPRWNLVKQPTAKQPSTKIALISGLEFDSGTGNTLRLDLLSDFLIGEGSEAAAAQKIVRLIIAGNSMESANPIPKREDKKKYSQRDANEPTAWNLSPVKRLDLWLASILPTLPVTLIPGELDPTSVALPQPPVHSAYFANTRKYLKPAAATAVPDHGPWFDTVTNPWDGEVEGWRILATGGQPVNDMFKYTEGEDRLGMMEHFLRWRNIAPTAPDTLCKSPNSAI